jgi:ribosomal protein S9
VYAIRQALAKAVVAYYQKFVDEASKKEVKVRAPRANSEGAPGAFSCAQRRFAPPRTRRR